MESDETKFPQYRKYVGVDTWYKIVSTELFIELKKVGKHVLIEEVVAHQYPEKLRIQDMLDCKDNHWKSVTEEEFVQFKTAKE
jgi:hypothetical protein